MKAKKDEIKPNSDLSNLNFRGSDLEYTNIENCNLEGVDFEGSYLVNCRFKNSNLKGVRLMGVNLSGAWLTNVNFEGADLRGSSITMKQIEACENCDKAIISKYQASSFGQNFIKKHNLIII